MVIRIFQKRCATWYEFHLLDDASGAIFTLLYSIVGNSPLSLLSLVNHLWLDIL